MSNQERFKRFSDSKLIREDLKGKSVRGALSTAAWSGIDFGLKMAATVILARLLTPEDYGLVAMVTAVTGMADGVRDLGLSTATVQTDEINHCQVSNLFWINAGGGAFFFLLFCGMSFGLGWFYGEPRLVPITVAISLTYILSGLSVQHGALLSRQIKQGHLAGIRLIAGILSAIAAILFALKGYGYWALVYRELIRGVLIPFGLWVCCPWIPGLPNRNAKIGNLLRFGRDLSLISIIIGLLSRFNELLVGKLFGSTSLGLYRQAHNLILVPLDEINGPILSVAQPSLSRLHSYPDQYRKYYQRILFCVAAAGIPFGIIVAVFSKEITLVLLGKKWVDCAPFVMVFAMHAAIGSAAGTGGLVLISLGKTKRALFLLLAYSLLLLGFVLLGTHWGPIGVAASTLVTGLVFMVPSLYLSFRNTPLSVGFFFGTMRPPLIAGIVMLGAVLAFKRFAPITGVVQSLAVGAAVGSLAYLLVIFLLPGSRRLTTALLGDVVSSFRGKGRSGSKERLDPA